MNLKIIFRDFKIGIRNLINYFPIIWRTRSWDYGYLEQLLLFKLKEMYKALKNGNAAALPENSEYWKAIKALKIAINLLERKQNNFYNNLDVNVIFKVDINQRDWKWFCNILEKYESYWWD